VNATRRRERSTGSSVPHIGLRFVAPAVLAMRKSNPIRARASRQALPGMMRFMNPSIYADCVQTGWDLMQFAYFLSVASGSADHIFLAPTK
jgi:hypothetical protein